MHDITELLRGLVLICSDTDCNHAYTCRIWTDSNAQQASFANERACFFFHHNITESFCTSKFAHFCTYCYVVAHFLACRRIT